MASPWKALLAASLLTLSSFAASSSAQEVEDQTPFPPLRPSDTSSPRDTLRSFLTATEELIEEWRARRATPRIMLLQRGARETMDFVGTPYASSVRAQNERIFLLWEILARVELPAYDQIPGNEEVSKLDVRKWTVPNTWIAIERVESGPQQGDYLFSAETVERLAVDYRRVKDLPYKAGLTGVYEEWRASATG